MSSSSSVEKSTPTRRSPENEEVVNRDVKGMVVLEKFKGVKKRPSRFRMNMNFWKRSKSAGPPVSAQRGAVVGTGSEDDGGMG
jgi:3',5'-cyclic-nucleotide phosphodiesterase